jgi:hypothetical protein
VLSQTPARDGTSADAGPLRAVALLHTAHADTTAIPGPAARTVCAISLPSLYAISPFSGNT